ncbi:hypothetical protein, conserved [Babesia ovata]|uniref:Uncharacterized protein n=1 Tax=Babesia ovata TaxID=189622 RepID=A0A2H6K9Z1_9APIC|nr:uncharacterized protein BOVATA_013150 [Babesia ovata]GBE59822.1 hypothetical protein, conserved [Babesia ovata]
MDPLALLEQQCLQSRKDKGKRTNEEDNAGDSDTAEAQASDDNSSEKPEVEVIAHFTYPNREQHTSSDDEKRATREDRERSRSRSRSRSREKSEHKAKKRHKEPDERTHRKEDGNAGVTVDKAAVESDPLPVMTSMHQMSPLDRMLLRREQLLMRQSQKFLKDVKRQLDAT